MSQLLFGNKFGSLEELAADIYVMLYVPLPPPIFFYNFSQVLINIHEYLNKIICIAYHWVKVFCLGFDLVPSLIAYDN